MALPFDINQLSAIIGNLDLTNLNSVLEKSLSTSYVSPTVKKELNLLASIPSVNDAIGTYADFNRYNTSSKEAYSYDLLDNTPNSNAIRETYNMPKTISVPDSVKLSLGGNTLFGDKSNIFQKAGSFIGKTATKFKNSGVGQALSNPYTLLGLDVGNLVLTGFVGDKMFGGPKGNITLAIDQGWDLAANLAANFGPWGLLASGVMKGLNIMNKGVNLALGSKALDNMTTADAALNNPLTGWNVGLVNALGGNTTRSFTKDTFALETIGSSYAGSNAQIDDALSKANKRYGLVSNKARRAANRQISEAARQQNIMSSIAEDTSDRFALRDAMSDINGFRRSFAMLGGYDLAAVRVGRHGMSLQRLNVVKTLLSSSTIKELTEIPFEYLDLTLEEVSVIPEEFLDGEINEVTLDTIPLEYLDSIISEVSINDILPEFKEGGIIEAKDDYQEFCDTLPNNLKPKEGDHYNMRLCWELNGRPKTFNEVKGTVFTYNKRDKSWHAPSVAYDENTDEYIFLKSPDHPTFELELDAWYNSNDLEIVELRKTHKLDPINWKYIPKDVEEFKKGGKFNVIPEGALHARLHHMEDDENITKKGIPVVSESENGEIEQQAEIEKEEIIFRLDVTKKLEELAKQDTDEAAIEAGKLLVLEILFNTVDNTNSLL